MRGRRDARSGCRRRAAGRLACLCGLDVVRQQRSPRAVTPSLGRSAPPPGLARDTHTRCELSTTPPRPPLAKGSAAAGGRLCLRASCYRAASVAPAVLLKENTFSTPHHQGNAHRRSVTHRLALRPRVRLARRRA
eukprot:6694593-Prymnesium_polylepis.1